MRTRHRSEIVVLRTSAGLRGFYEREKERITVDLEWMGMTGCNRNEIGGGCNDTVPPPL